MPWRCELRGPWMLPRRRQTWGKGDMSTVHPLPTLTNIRWIRVYLIQPFIIAGIDGIMFWVARPNT